MEAEEAYELALEAARKVMFRLVPEDFVTDNLETSRHHILALLDDEMAVAFGLKPAPPAEE